MESLIRLRIIILVFALLAGLAALVVGYYDDFSGADELQGPDTIKSLS